MADGAKAKAGVERTLDYLTKLVNDILEKYPAGSLPPIDKMSQRSRRRSGGCYQWDPLHLVVVISIPSLINADILLFSGTLGAVL